MRLVLNYCRLVLSSTHFGKRDNLKLFASIMTLVGRKCYPSRRRFAKTLGAIYGYLQFLSKLSMSSQLK